MIVVVDYSISNIGSLVNMIKKIGKTALVSNRLEDIEQAEKLILPGIGSFDAGMQRLLDLNLVAALNKKVMVEKIPALGICLGMQLMTQKSSEGKLAGLAWFDAQVVRFDFTGKNLNARIPHIGWNFTEQKKQTRLFEHIGQAPKFYFVHSYHVVPNHDDDILSITHHGHDFVSAIQHENVAGVQFHPEKSHKFGEQFLRNFIEYF